MLKKEDYDLVSNPTEKIFFMFSIEFDSKNIISHLVSDSITKIQYFMSVVEFDTPKLLFGLL